MISGDFGDDAVMRSGYFLLVSAGLILVGCQRDAGNATVNKPVVRTKTVAPVKKGPSQDELTAGMVEAASTLKSDAPIDLKFDLRSRPEVGRPLEIEIALMPQISAALGIIRVNGPETLSLGAGSAQIDIPNVVEFQVYKRVIHVTPSAEGVLVLTLNATLRHEEIEEYRVFSIPLIVAGR